MRQVRHRAALPVTILWVVLLVAGLPKPVAAFKPHVHETLVRTPLAPAGIPADAMNHIVGSFPSGAGNLGSDRHQSDAYRHFDNAPDPATVCTRARDAWMRFYTEIRSAVTPGNAPDYSNVQGFVQARQSFGALTHALQDFYSHSNWIESFLDRNQNPPMADTLFPSCNPAMLPADLQTGFFQFALTNWDGCPSTGPPTGFRHCHETLNKDDGFSIQGSRTVPGLTVTYHQVAAQIAAAHTYRLYQIVVAELQKDWSAAFPKVRADCLVAHVFQASTQPCRYGRLTVTNMSPSISLGNGNLELIGPSGQKLENFVFGWPVPPIQTSLCLSGLTARWSFVVRDEYSLPTPRRAEGSGPLSAIGCDGQISIDAKAAIHYLVRFTSTDTKLPIYTEVIFAVNNGSRAVSAGAVPAGASVWVDLGPCPTVANFDIIIRFTEPGTGIPRTALPDPPPVAANPACQDTIKFDDLGGKHYGP